MLRKQDNNPIWLTPIRALSPQELAGKVSPAVHVAVLVGAQDDVAPPSMSSHYAETLKTRVSNVTLTIAPGLGHDILLEPVMYGALRAWWRTSGGQVRIETSTVWRRPLPVWG